MVRVIETKYEKSLILIWLREELKDDLEEDSPPFTIKISNI